VLDGDVDEDNDDVFGDDVEATCDADVDVAVGRAVEVDSAALEAASISNVPLADKGR